MRIARLLLFFLLVPAAYAQTWTAKVVSVTKNPDGQTFQLEFTLTDGTTTKNGPSLKLSDPDEIRRRLADYESFENRAVAQSSKLATLDPAVYAGKTTAQLQAIYDAAHPAPVKTQAEIDRDTWLAAKADWQLKLKVFQAGVSTTVKQADVDAAYALMKSLYKDEYGAFL